MEAPTLRGLEPTSEAPADAATSEHGTGQKLLVAAGIAGMGVYIGHSLLYAQEAHVPQALWSTGDEKDALSAAPAPACPRVVVVNASDEVQGCAQAGLAAWLDLRGEVELEFPTVIMVEEGEATTLADLPGEVRRAALFAWAELRGRRDRSAACVGASTPLACVVYRAMSEVDGQALDDWDVRAAEVRRWSGRRFATRHCVAVTVDGRHTTAVVHDVEGVLEAAAAAPASPPYSSRATPAPADCAALVRQCGAATAATFQRWRLGMAPSSPSPSPANSRIPAAASARLLRRDGAGASPAPARRGDLWLGPYSVFAALGAVLRYNRADAGVYPAYLATPRPASSAATRAAASWLHKAGALALRLAGPLMRGYAARQEQWRERQRRLSAPFVVALTLAAPRAAVTPDVLAIAERHVAAWLHAVTSAAPPSATATPRFAVRDVPSSVDAAAHVACPNLDVTDAVCTVLAAEWLLLEVTSLFAALGLAPAHVQLVAVPSAAAASSLLYPAAGATVEEDVCTRRHHLWAPSVLRRESVAVCTRDGLQRMGVVVCAHDLIDL